MTAPHTSIRRSTGAIWTVVVGVGAAVGLTTSLVPAHVTPYIAVVFILGSVGLWALERPIVFVHALLFLSALSGLIGGLQNEHLQGLYPTLQGLTWITVGIVAAALLGVHLVHIRIPKHYYLFLLFVLWALVRLMTASPTRAGARHLLYYALPLLVGLHTVLAVTRSHQQALRSIRKTLVTSVWLAPILYVLFVPLGIVWLTAGGPYGLVLPRPTALFLLVILSVALAIWRYGVAPGARRVGRLAAIVAVATIFFTLSRMAIAVSVLLLVMHRVSPKRPIRVTLFAIIAAALTIPMLLAVPPLRERFIAQVPGVEGVSRLNLSNRDILWPAILVRLPQRPLTGFGPGSARDLGGQLLGDPNGVYPHNEYLQITHDLGLVGLLIFLVAWIHVGRRSLGLWVRAHDEGNDETALWASASTFVVVVILLTALTDNTILYPFVMAPAFIVFECAAASARHAPPLQPSRVFGTSNGS